MDLELKPFSKPVDNIRPQILNRKCLLKSEGEDTDQRNTTEFGISRVLPYDWQSHCFVKPQCFAVTTFGRDYGVIG